MGAERKVCTICGLRANARALCATHYAQARARGEFGRPCSVPNCPKWEHAGGLCNSHYNERRRQTGYYNCKHEGCARRHVRDFLCLEHLITTGAPMYPCRIASCTSETHTPKNGLCPSCKDRKTKYPDLRDVDLEMLVKGIPCQICKESPATDVDHCHETGWFRGFLCSSCNRGLGVFRDRDDVMHRAIEYLWRNSPLHQEWRCNGSVAI